MLSPNVKPSLGYPILAGAKIAPQSVGAGATITGAWVALPPDVKWLIAQLLVGAGAGTWQVDLEQATDVAGTGAKALATAAIPALTAADADAEVNLDTQLDFANNFAFVRAKLTCTGGAGTLGSVGIRTGPAAFMG